MADKTEEAQLQSAVKALLTKEPQQEPQMMTDAKQDQGADTMIDKNAMSTRIETPHENKKESNTATSALMASAARVKEAEKQESTSAALEEAAEIVIQNEEAAQSLAAAAEAVVPDKEETLAALKESAANVEAQIAAKLKQAVQDNDQAVEGGAKRLEEVTLEDQAIDEAAARLQLEITKESSLSSTIMQEEERNTVPLTKPPEKKMLRRKKKKKKKPQPLDRTEHDVLDLEEEATERRTLRKSLSAKREAMYLENQKDIERGAKLEARLLPRIQLNTLQSQVLVSAYHGDAHGVARAARRLGVQEGLGLRAALLTDQATGLSVAHVAAIRGHTRLFTELGRAWRREATDECELSIAVLCKRISEVATTLSTTKAPGKLRLALIRQEFEYCTREVDILYRSLEQRVEANWRAVLTKRDTRGRSVLQYASACHDDGTILRTVLSDEVRGHLSARSSTHLSSGLKALTDAEATKLLREKQVSISFFHRTESKNSAPLFPSGVRFDASTGKVIHTKNLPRKVKRELLDFTDESSGKLSNWVKKDLIEGARRRLTRHGDSPRGNSRRQLLDAFQERAHRDTVTFADLDATFRDLGVTLAKDTMIQIARRYRDRNGEIDYEQLIDDAVSAEADDEAKHSSDDEMPPETRPEVDDCNDFVQQAKTRSQDLIEARRGVLNVQDEAGYTALHVLAYRSAPVDLIEFLIKAGARRSIPSSSGTLPEDLATRQSVKQALRKRVLCELDKAFITKKKEAFTKARSCGFSADKMPGQFFDDGLGDCRFRLKNNGGDRAKGALDAITSAAIEASDADTLRRSGTPGAPLLDDAAFDTHWRRVPQRKERIGFDLNRYKMQFSKYFDPSAFPLDRKLGDGRLRSPLHLAAEAGLFDVARKLLGFQSTEEEYNKTLFEVDAHDADGWTPLHHAAARGGEARREIAALLFKANADSNARNLRGRTPLHLACASAVDSEDEDVEMVAVLCRYSSTGNLDATDDAGETALMVAAARGRVKTVAALLARSASPWFRHSKTRATALHMACVSRAQNAADAARLLAQWCSGGDGELVHYLTSIEPSRSTGISDSSKIGHDREFPTEGFVHRSLDASSIEYQAQHTQRTVVAPAHSLFSSGQSTYAKINFCTKLIDKTDLRSRRLTATPLAAARDAKGDTPRDSARSKEQKDALDHLWAAALSGSLVRLKLAVQSRLNSRKPALYSLSAAQPWLPVSTYDLTPISGRNALHLLALGACRALAAADRKRSTLSTHKQAAANDFASCARYLLTSTRVDIDAEDFTARTPLHYAAASGCLPLLREFLSNGADVTIVDERGGFTALHLASAWCRHDAHSALLDAGASPGAKDHHGRNSRDVLALGRKLDLRLQTEPSKNLSAFLKRASSSSSSRALISSSDDEYSEDGDYSDEYN